MNRHVTWYRIPLVGSFGVYLIPLTLPHVVILFGPALLYGLGHRERWWIAADLSLALTAQLLVALMLVWSLKGSRLRLLAWIPAVPILVAGVNAAYLWAIPSYFLIEPDTRPEVKNWTEHCLVPNVSLTPVRTSVNRSGTAVREWWVQRPDARYGLLQLPDCGVVDVDLPRPTVQPGGRVDFTLSVVFSAPGRAAIVERLVTSTSAQSWWLLTDPSSALRPIEQPAQAEGTPILSDTADAVGWMEPVKDSGPPVLQRVIIRPLPSSSSQNAIVIELAPFGPALYALLAIDTVAREAVLWRDDQPLVVGFDGHRRETPSISGPIRAQSITYLRHGRGWVAWDAYREDGPYQLSWSLAAGTGTVRTNKGRSITSAAVDPSGRLIAMSETTTLNIGTARDMVSVIRTNDGADVFRLYLPRYTRSPVMFFDEVLFGYSDAAGTHVLRVSR